MEAHRGACGVRVAVGNGLSDRFMFAAEHLIRCNAARLIGGSQTVCRVGNHGRPQGL